MLAAAGADDEHEGVGAEQQDGDGVAAEASGVEGVPTDPDARGAQAAACLSQAELNAQDRRIACAWVQSKPLRDLIVMRLVMVPLAELMQAHLALGSHKWETDQRRRELQAIRGGMAEGDAALGREYRIAIAAKGVIEDRFSAKLQYLLTEPAMWSLILPADVTEAANSFAFRLLSRSGCLVAELLEEKHRKHPFRMFLLLSYPELAGRIVKEPPCMFGKFAAKFLEENPDLHSQEARMRLLAVASAAKTDLAHLESLHATIRRNVLAMSHQCPRVELARASAEWVASRCRSRAKHSTAGVRTNIVGVGPSEAQAADIHQPSRKPRGGGGAWRAFVAMHDPGLFKDFAALAQEYRSLTAEQAAKYVQVGRAATQVHQLQSNKSPFGPSSRELERQARARQREQYMQQLADKADRKAEPLQLAVASHVVQTCQSSAVALREAQLGSLYLGKFLAERDRRVDADLQAFSADRGILHDALGHERALAAFEQDLQPVPQQACLECDVVPDIGSAVAKVCSASHAAKDIAGRSDSAALAASWNRRHNIVRHTEAQAIPDEDQEAKWKCWRFGCCICCADGKRLYRVRNAVLRAMKRAFPSKSDRRQLQAQGAIFIALRSQAPGGDGPVDLVDGDNLLIFHIGLQYFKPYRPTYQEMIVMEKGMNGEWRLQVAALWGYMRVSKLCVKSWMCEANFEALGRQVEEWVAHGLGWFAQVAPHVLLKCLAPATAIKHHLASPPRH